MPLRVTWIKAGCILVAGLLCLRASHAGLDCNQARSSAPVVSRKPGTPARELSSLEVGAIEVGHAVRPDHEIAAVLQVRVDVFSTERRLPDGILRLYHDADGPRVEND